MAITRTKKEEILTKLDEVKKNSETVVFVHFERLPVTEGTEMRRSLREDGVGYYVAKKNLLKRAFGTGYEGEWPTLDGEIAIAYSADPMAPAQSIQAFAKQHKDQVSIVGGIFQGVFKNQHEMVEIASIPGIDTLRGMFVNVINSPIQGLAVALAQIAEQKEA